MQSESNPYRSPTATDTDVPPSDIRRPPSGTFLVGIWLLEGGFKAFVVGAWLKQGFIPIRYVVDDYHTWDPFLFFLLSSFMIVETIGPWIGIYYLTGRRSRVIPFSAALLRTLKVAVGIAICATSTLMLFCEFLGSRH